MEALIGILASVLPVLYVLGAAIALDLITGVWAAWRSGTLNPEFLPTFFTSQVLTKAAPIVLALVAGIAVAGTSTAAAIPIIGAAGTAGAAYLWSLVNSIVSNVQEGQSLTKSVPTSVALKAAVTPVAPPVDNIQTESADAVALDNLVPDENGDDTV